MRGAARSSVLFFLFPGIAGAGDFRPLSRPSFYGESRTKSVFRGGGKDKAAYSLAPLRAAAALRNDLKKLFLQNVYSRSAQSRRGVQQRPEKKACSHLPRMRAAGGGVVRDRGVRAYCGSRAGHNISAPPALFTFIRGTAASRPQKHIYPPERATCR